MKALYDKFGWPALIAATFAVGLAVLLVATIRFVAIFVWRRKRYVPDYKADRAELGRSVFWSLVSMAGNAVLMFPIQLGIVKGYSRMYFSVGEYGWLYLPFSAVALLAVSETLTYWVHRVLHSRFLYGLHAKHHEFKKTTPLMAVAFIPLDAFLQGLPYHLCIYAFPIHVWVYQGFFVCITLWAISIHDRTTWLAPKGLLVWLVNHTGCHTVHHWFGTGNFGQITSIWDRICGTYKHPQDLPAEFFAAVPGRAPPPA